MKTVTGNILDAEDDLICHQCNCVTTDAAGLAAAIFEKFPYADVYSSREKTDGSKNENNWLLRTDDRSVPGTIEVRGDGIMERRVVAMYAQFFPGRPKPSTPPVMTISDSEEKRLQFFQSCLDAIAKVPDVKSIAFPWQIGCGLARGDWEKYSALLHEFSGLVDADVIIYQLA